MNRGVKMADFDLPMGGNLDIGSANGWQRAFPTKSSMDMPMVMDVRMDLVGQSFRRTLAKRWRSKLSPRA